jgi:Nif-specific regulatory protein
MMPPPALPPTAPAALGGDTAAEFDAEVDADVAQVGNNAPLPESDGKPEGERERLIWAMERCGWVQAKAARLLKISPRQMGYALQKNGIEVRKF